MFCGVVLASPTRSIQKRVGKDPAHFTVWARRFWAKLEIDCKLVVHPEILVDNAQDSDQSTTLEGWGQGMVSRYIADPQRTR